MPSNVSFQFTIFDHEKNDFKTEEGDLGTDPIFYTNVKIGTYYISFSNGRGGYKSESSFSVSFTQDEIAKIALSAGTYVMSLEGRSDKSSEKLYTMVVMK